MTGAQEAEQGFSVMNLFVVPVAPGRSRAYFKVFTNVESKFAKVPRHPFFRLSQT